MSAKFDNDPEFNDALPKPKSRRAFRIVELMVVIGIIAVLIALLLPVMRRSAGPAAHRAMCVNNLKQIALALLTYERAHGTLPPAYTVNSKGVPLHSWRTLILPYLEQRSLYQTIDLSKPWNDPANANARETAVSVFRCPVAAGPLNTTTYLAIAGPNGCLVPAKGRRLSEITDTHESTLMVIDAGAENAVPWMAPVDADESLVLSIGPKTKLHHAGGTNACLVDGSVRFLKTNIRPSVRHALMTISGNDTPAAYEW
jgi:prepilin-type processing-associated H-X9-DG protein